jgi:hypothetical protein
MANPVLNMMANHQKTVFSVWWILLESFIIPSDHVPVNLPGPFTLNCWT